MEKPFTAKWYEELIFSSCDPELKKDKHTRKFMKTIAERAAEAFKIGRADAREGKPEVGYSEFLKAAGYQTEADDTYGILTLAQSAYSSGYQLGMSERGNSV